MVVRMTTKQEEIREGMERIVLEQLADDSPWQAKSQLAKFIVKVLQTYEDSQGVVIRVNENRLPTISYNTAYPENEEIYQQEMLKAVLENL